MGLIRFLLAIAVIVSHNINLFGLTFIGSEVAVQGFFIISGFYMGLILNEKYSKKKYFLFISNRFLRLLPMYWAIVLLMIVISIMWYNFSDTGNRLFFDHFFQPDIQPSITTWIAIFFSNIFMVFQDMFLFLGISPNGSLEFISNFSTAEEPLANFLIVSPAWTVGLELAFYFLVPFIINFKTAYIVFLGIFSLGLRLILYNYDYDFDPWTYRFFPFEILFFLVGILCFRFYTFLKQKKVNNRLSTFMFFLLIGYIIVFQFIPVHIVCKEITFFFLLFVCIPFIFIKLKDSKLDHFIGEFSYPMYLSHVFISIVIGIFNSKYFYFSKQISDIITILSTIFFSFIIIRVISNPIEKWRQWRVIQNEKL
jgi:peptidoglycan/LPS O-acetylase OafA/YrhL